MEVDLLTALDAAVKRDGSDPRLHGRISFGVRDDAGEFRFWMAELTDHSAKTGFFSALPRSEVALVMDAQTADAVLQGAPVANPLLLAMEGDETLLASFFSRYFQQRSWLDIRMGR